MTEQHPHHHPHRHGEAGSHHHPQQQQQQHATGGATSWGAWPPSGSPGGQPPHWTMPPGGAVPGPAPYVGGHQQSMPIMAPPHFPSHHHHYQHQHHLAVHFPPPQSHALTPAAATGHPPQHLQHPHVHHHHHHQVAFAPQPAVLANQLPQHHAAQHFVPSGYPGQAPAGHLYAGANPMFLDHNHNPLVPHPHAPPPPPPAQMIGDQAVTTGRLNSAVAQPGAPAAVGGRTPTHGARGEGPGPQGRHGHPASAAGRRVAATQLTTGVGHVDAEGGEEPRARRSAPGGSEDITARAERPAGGGGAGADARGGPVTTSQGGASGGSDGATTGGATQVIVIYLDNQTTSAEVLGIFKAAGPVDCVRLMYDAETNEPLGYGFVYFVDAAGARAAVSRFNGFRLRKKRLKVAFANPRHVKPAVAATDNATTGPRHDAMTSADPSSSHSPSGDQPPPPVPAPAAIADPPSPPSAPLLPSPETAVPAVAAAKTPEGGLGSDLGLAHGDLLVIPEPAI